MKSRIKAFIKFSLTGIGSMLLFSAIYISYIFSDFNRSLDEVKINLVVNKIKEAKKHDEKLIELYDKINEGSLEKSVLNHLWDMIWGKEKTCPCLYATQLFQMNIKRNLAENGYTIASKIAQEVGQKACLDYILDNHDFLYGNKGVDAAASYYFMRKVGDLGEDEMIGLIIMLENPSFFNPKRNNGKYWDKIGKVKASLI